MAILVDELRAVIEGAREAAGVGDTAAVDAALEAALAMLDAGVVLTPAQAAAVIGIAEPLIVVGWCHNGKLRCEKRGEQTLVPWAEAERIKETPEAERVRQLDAVLAASTEIGGDDPLSEAELEMLSDSRSGRLPWQRTATPVASGRST